jgi:hypothetical protein
VADLQKRDGMPTRESLIPSKQDDFQVEERELPLKEICRFAFVLGWVGLAAVAMRAQAPAEAHGATPQGGAQTVAVMLQPALDGLHTTMQGLHLDKWKGGSVRAEAERNISSIMHDLEGALPPLVASADAAPGLVSAALPAARNVDALYDVVLRVYDAARVAAPGEQVEALQQAMSGLDNARRALTDHVAALADAQQKQVGDLQARLKAQAAPVCPVPPPAPVCPAPKKTVKKKAKPATKTPAAPPSGTTPQPNQ